ncbi:hypothetical protein KAR91_01955 [Candidatus Pacearchaeota archaeon]|nr:hypothetical protein [Candidatus Pacearchaeota archaeon]
MWDAAVNLFKGGIDATIGSLGKAIDDNVTSDEERLVLKNELAKIEGNIGNQVRDFQKSMEGEITERLKADNASDSWLSKNIRPMTLIFLMVTTMMVVYATIFSELTKDKIEMVKAWIPLLTALDVTAVGFYFGSRGMEKIKSILPK